MNWIFLYFTIHRFSLLFDEIGLNSDDNADDDDDAERESKSKPNKNSKSAKTNNTSALATNKSTSSKGSKSAQQAKDDSDTESEDSEEVRFLFLSHCLFPSWIEEEFERSNHIDVFHLICLLINLGFAKVKKHQATRTEPQEEKTNNYCRFR